MECLASLILFFASLSASSIFPVLPFLVLVIWEVERRRPSVFCGIILYILLVIVVMYEDGEGFGLFDALKLSPKDLESNIMLRVKYDLTLGLGRTPHSKALVFSPAGETWNFLRAFIRYLLEPNYGNIYRE